jgi:TolB-like protein/Tfp pilus assembly protein PilF
MGVHNVQSDALGNGEESNRRTALIRDELRKILASPGFVHSARMRQFLELVVENSLSGATSLKETVIGVQLFGRAPDYDSSAEPIVRVEARRLRQKLQQYYERDGAVSPVVIHLPKGGYTPEFETRAVLVEPGSAGTLPLPESAAVAPPNAVTAAPAKRLGSRVVLWRAMAAICCLGALSIGIASFRPSAFSGVPPARASGSIASIAVLPLVNLSGDSAQDYLADGMTDELIGSLARIPALRVISRTSAMQYKGARKALPEIARELRVDAVVEGSLTRSGEQVRITVQLIDAKVDRHLWSEDYRRPIGDMLGVESDVARAIAAQVRLTLATEPEFPVRRQTEVAPGAWDAYLKGRYFWNKRTEEGLRKSLGYFQEAVTEAPGFARAWAGLADSWLLLGESWLRPNGEAFRETEKALDKALSLDDALGEAHACRAALECDRGRWERAEPEFRRALELSPGYATAHQWYAEGLAAHGGTEEALVEIRRARDLDPLSLPVNVQVGYILFLARRYDESIAQLRATVDMDPYFWMAHADLGHAYEQKRMYPEAIRELQKSVDLTQSASQTLWLAHAWALAGRKAEASRVRSTLEQSFAQGHIEAPLMALLDTALGEPDRALARLQSACSAHARIVLSPTPMLDPLRADPRIAAVLAHCGAVD